MFATSMRETTVEQAEAWGTKCAACLMVPGFVS